MWTFISTSSLQTKERKPVLLTRLYTARAVEKYESYDESFAGVGLGTRGQTRYVRTNMSSKILRQNHFASWGTARYHPCIMKLVTLLPLLFLFMATLTATTYAQIPASQKREVEAVYPEAHALYLDLHQTPELSSHETQTAAKLAERLRSLGYEVTEHVGGTGIVAILKNGAGPTVMLRTELDALPVEEKTGLPYASKVHSKDDGGREVPVMHACGHDLHMAALFATAEIMAHSKNSWRGTLMLIGQPAEETIGGAKAMIADGFATRFPKPDVGVALHVGNEIPAGAIGITSGIYNSNADSLRVTIYGKGGHGASPQTTIDPIVIAAKTIL